MARARRSVQAARVSRVTSYADDRFFGIEGSHYVYKVVATQMLTIALQAPYKLPIMAGAATMTGAGYPRSTSFDPMFVPLFWIFLAALVVNALYPSVLLRSQDARVQRDAVAWCDAALDIHQGHQRGARRRR